MTNSLWLPPLVKGRYHPDCTRSDARPNRIWSVAELDLGDKAAEFTEQSLKAFSYKGKLYGMPYATENVGFFYNKDLVTTVPTTWQEVYDISKALIDEDKIKFYNLGKCKLPCLSLDDLSGWLHLRSG